MMSPILVTGAAGQVGLELARALAVLRPLRLVDRQECNLADAEAIRRVVRATAPCAIVNAAAYTAVDQAETDPESAFAINAMAPGVLGAIAAETGVPVLHYSTDYVFDGSGTRPWRETDTPAPLNVYGQSKLAGERALAAATAQHLILRTSWVFGAYGGNFARTMLRLAAERESLTVVDDQIGAPTAASLLADVSAQLLGRLLSQPRADFPYGLYHCAAAGETSWFGYAQYLIAAARAHGIPLKLPEAGLQPTCSAHYPTPARRPANSRLDCRHFCQTFGLTLPAWQESVERWLMHWQP
ncbi:MAG: dTDP-4-dehydrorhamnose reductase [Zoogloeaceae bacterium]|jgi:dTDP-4-dehydrorhamnose reductase|nr:dTDP-4-dehydrorhamnose reductase [Zoogloeaceae bacterium]